MMKPSERGNKQGLLLLMALFIIAAAAGVFIWFCTKIAPWGYSDSAAYFSTARNFASGKGFGIYNADGTFTRLSIFAPLYSFVLSGFAKAGIDLVQASRWLDIVFLSLLVFLSGWFFFKITNSSVGGILVALLIGTTPILMVDFSSMMSEPLGILLTVPAILLAALAVKKSSTGLLIFSAILADLAVFSRYALVAVPIAGTLIIFFLWEKSWNRRFKKALVYSVVSFGPMILWLLPEFFNKASLGNRHIAKSIAIGDRTLDYLSRCYKTVKYWLPYRTNMFPGISADAFSPILLIVFIALVVTGLILALGRRGKEENTRPIAALELSVLIFLAVYFLVLAFAFIFTKSVDINGRMLSPIVPFLYLLLLNSVCLIGGLFKQRTFEFTVGLVITALFVVFNFIPLRTYAIYASGYPDGYTSPAWQGRPIFAEVDSLPDSTPLLSNAPDVLLFYTNRSSYRLVNIEESRGTNIAAGDTVSLDKIVRDECGVIVLFKNSDAVAYENDEDILSDTQTAELTAQFHSIYSDSKDALLIDSTCSSYLGE